MRAYMYVISRDFGFAPNPFHGVCTLATCKPRIRKMAQVGDWVIGMGAAALKAKGKCVFAMRVSRCLSFDAYYCDPLYRVKKPVRNGSRIMMLGDNIYHHRNGSNEWQQDDSHHSKPDGSVNPKNLEHDTQVDRVLVSDHYYYFGQSAPVVPPPILGGLAYRNVRDYQVYSAAGAQELLDWLEHTYDGLDRQILGDPFDFRRSELRYDLTTDTVR